MTFGDGLAATTRGGLPQGWHGQYWASHASTQDAARAAIASGASARSVFVADFQSAGRGRHGRVWRAPPGTSLLVSIVLQQPGPPSIWGSTALASVAMLEAIQALAPMLRPAIKWPNDVLLEGRKVAGILAESTWDGDRATVIVGAGVNVTTESEAFEDLPGATSIAIESGRRVDRGELLLTFLSRIDAWLVRPEAELQAVWQARLWGQGQRVRLADRGAEIEVIVLGAEADGSLRVRLPDGTERTTATGELSL